MRLRWLVEGIVLASRTQATTVKFSLRTPPSTVVQTSPTPAVSMPPTKRRKAAPILSSLLCTPGRRFSEVATLTSHGKIAPFPLHHPRHQLLFDETRLGNPEPPAAFKVS